MRIKMILWLSLVIAIAMYALAIVMDAMTRQIKTGSPPWTKSVIAVPASSQTEDPRVFYQFLSDGSVCELRREYGIVRAYWYVDGKRFEVPVTIVYRSPFLRGGR